MEVARKPTPFASQSASGAHAPVVSASSSNPSKLLDRLRAALRARHYRRRTEQTYALWGRRFLCFHNVRHPAAMAEPEINAFLTHLAVKEKVSASTRNQALSALLFLYRCVIGREVGDLGAVIRARKPRQRPVVMTRAEVQSAHEGARMPSHARVARSESRAG